MSGFDKMPPSWTEVPFDDAVEVISDRGIRIKQKDYLGAGAVPVIDQGDGLIGGYTDDCDARIEAQLPLFVFGDHTRRFKFVSFPFAVGADGVKLFAPNELWEPRFLFYQLEAVDLENRGYGRHYQYLRKESLRLPPPQEQIRIVEKLEELLSDLDAGVAELKAAQRKLAQYRQSLLKAAVEGALTADWRAARYASIDPPPSSFPRKRESSGSALPTEKTMDSRFRGNDGRGDATSSTETGADLLQHILTERRARWETRQLAKFAEQGKTPPKDWKAKYPEPIAPDTSDLPALPEGWVWSSVDQLSDMIRNGLSQKPNTEHLGYPILRINAVRPMSVRLDEVRHLALSEKEASSYLLDEGDLLATRYNGSVDLLGVFGVVRGLVEPTVHPDKLIRIKPVLGAPLADWIEMCASTGASRKHIVARVKTTAGQTGISGEDIKKMPIPLPPISEQLTASAMSSTTMASIADHEIAVDRALKQSAAQRKNILKAAFAGQLVPQDPNDEAASALLERIRAERTPGGTMGAKRGRKAREAL